jgi:hypothetical protein
MQIKAMCIPKDGYSSQHGIPADSSNAAFLKRVVSRATEIHDGLKNLRVKSGMADEPIQGRINITTATGTIPFGFDFNKVNYDCGDGHAPRVILTDERRDRGLVIELNSSNRSAIESLPALSMDSCCTQCGTDLNETEMMKGDNACHTCVVNSL